MTIQDITAPILAITDGVTRIDLLSDKSGWLLKEWIPKELTFKNDGVRIDSPVADGQRIIAAYYDNIVDTLTLIANEKAQDQLIELDLQELRRLLAKATDYWGHDWWGNSGLSNPSLLTFYPVWIEARAPKETNIRYAIIHEGKIPDDPNPYTQPFFECPTSTGELTLILEHGIWQSTVPTLDDRQYISATGKGRLSSTANGNVDFNNNLLTYFSADNVFISNHGVNDNLTHGYVYDDSGGTFGVNIFSVPPPYELFPIPPAINDILYLGIAAANHAAFSSVVIAIGAAGANFSWIWEYWNGAAWVTLTVNEHNTLLAINVFSAFWRQPTNWATVAVNGVTALWVRIRITAVGSAAALEPHTEINREQPYAVQWSALEVQATDVGGDIPALIKIALTNRSDKDGPGGGEPDLWANRIICGLRSMSRDFNNAALNNIEFRAQLTASQYQNPNNQPFFDDITPSVGTLTIYAPAPESPVGQCAIFTSMGAEPMVVRHTWEIAYPHALTYAGKFRLFGRVQQVGGTSGQIEMMMTCEVGKGIEVYRSPVKIVPAIGAISLIDFGEVTTYPSSLIDFSQTLVNTAHVTFKFWADIVSGSPALNIYDIVLIPIDEWSCDIIDTTATQYTGLDSGATVSIDSARLQHEVIRSINQRNTDIVAIWQSITNGPAILQANQQQRLWFLFARRHDIPPASGDDWRGNFEIGCSVQVRHVQRYKGMRGSR